VNSRRPVGDFWNPSVMLLVRLHQRRPRDAGGSDARADAGLVKRKTVGIDATTLEANAALRSIVRRDTGEIYQNS
jgi:hypothetical protein